MRVRIWNTLFFLFIASLTNVSSYSFTEEFTEDWTERWIPSTDEKYKGKFERTTLDPDFGLQIPKKAQFYGLTAPLTETLDPVNGLILQFEAKWSKDQTCSGAYLKFYSHDSTLKPQDTKADTPYTIMFGPDKCGSTSKVHFILNHKSPKTSKATEKHLKDPAKVPVDKKTHIYTAVLKADQTFEILIDNMVVSEGSLLEKFDPPINPPEEIPDPDDHKPADWVDLAKIDDPEAVKPEDWVDEELVEDDEAIKPEGWLDEEPLEVPDPNAKKPEDWDEDEDGVWIAPLIPNPKCKKAPGCGEWHRPKIPNPDFKGPWRAPKIDNPEYKGPWKAKLIPNPDHFVDEAPLSNLAPIGSVGFELWTMDEGIIFDNIVITQDPELAKKYRTQWETTRHQLEQAKEEEELEQRKKQQSKDKTGAAGFIQGLIEDPRLKIIKPYLQPIGIFAEENTTAFYGVFAFIVAMLFVTLMTCCRRRTQEDDVGERKKKDITESDIAEPSNAQSTSKATNGTEAESKEEEQEEDEVKMEEEEEKEDEVQAKRRTSRTRRVD